MAGIGPETMRPEIVRGFATYALVVATPAVFLALSLRWFATPQAQPAFRLARLGRWRDVTAREAMAHPLHGTYGLMFSLLVGILLNVPVRALEFLSAIPPSPSIQPLWLKTLSGLRSDAHTSELQSLMRISYAIFSLKKINTRYQ